LASISPEQCSPREQRAASRLNASASLTAVGRWPSAFIPFPLTRLPVAFLPSSFILNKVFFHAKIGKIIENGT
jgi:hypothetical protein